MTALESVFPGDRLSRRQLHRHLGSPRSALGVLEDDAGRVLGYALLLVHARRRDARLYSIAVVPSLRGRGAGRALVNWALDRAAWRGAEGLRLEVRADNAAARSMYESMGFRLIGQRARYYEDGADALCLRRASGLAEDADAR